MALRLSFDPKTGMQEVGEICEATGSTTLLFRTNLRVVEFFSDGNSFAKALRQADFKDKKQACFLGWASIVVLRAAYQEPEEFDSRAAYEWAMSLDEMISLELNAADFAELTESLKSLYKPKPEIERVSLFDGLRIPKSFKPQCDLILLDAATV